MNPLSRREFVRKTALATVATNLAAALGAETVPPKAPTPKSEPAAPGSAPIRWLDGRAPRTLPGATWGVSWPAGQHAKETTFKLSTRDAASVPVQTWPLAFWPDGSLKWTAHAIPGDAPMADAYEVGPGTAVVPERPVRITESAEEIRVENGVFTALLARSGEVLVRQVSRGDKVVARNGRLVCWREDRSDPDVTRSERFQGAIERITVEQEGPVRAVVKIEGQHRAGTRSWLPFVVRWYFYSGSEVVRMMHTMIHDGDEQKDFIRGLGVRFDVPLRGELHDRHLRFAGQEDGLFAEAVRGLTGLRRDPGAQVRQAQLAGRATPETGTWPAAVAKRLRYIPAFGDWSLLQSSSDGFEIRKRTREGHTWISSARGTRAGGSGFAGTPDGGLAFGLRNFWQSHPAQLDIRGAAGNEAEVTVWLWAPDAGAMDLRPYHDGLGQDTFDKQLEGLEITYEDHEPGYDRPIGVARTSELYFAFCAATPDRGTLSAFAESVRRPPVLIPSPEHLQASAVFGGLWTPVDRSTPARAALEARLDWAFNFYRTEQEERRWYGFWNFGDVMHTYDPDRHEWRYDVGGFAWDNSELSTDLWLWLHFLRTGQADVFRFAEAMTRHTGEVDVHHIGRFAPLGSRHNVLHWGCSAKQLRISTAANRRYYYYLTGDERVGDLLREQVEAARALATVQANRKVARDRVTAPDPNATEVFAGFGTDWGALASAWLTEWERTGNPAMRERLAVSMRSIGAQPRGFFTGGARLNLGTGAFALEQGNRISVSHLSAVFGLVEVCAELIQLIEVPEFRTAWLDYCELYNAPAADQATKLGRALENLNLGQGHSRLTAYAAKLKADPDLARRAWTEFYDGKAGIRAGTKFASRRVDGPAALRPVEEALFVSTNAVAQWGLAAIQCLALAPDAQPDMRE